MSKREKLPIHTSPKGVLKFAWITKADTKFNPEGDYKADLILDGADAVALTEIVEAAQEAAQAEAEEKQARGKKAKAADLPIVAEYDDNDNETGRTIFKFKSKASGTTKEGKHWTRKLPVFDIYGKPFGDPVFGGSVVQLAFTAKPWVNPKLEYGVKLQLEAVQVHEASGGGGSAERYGFATQAAPDLGKMSREAAAEMGADDDDDGDY